MLAYTAHRPVAAQRRTSPNLLLLVIAGHVAVVALVMSAKMDLPAKFRDLRTEVHFLPAPQRKEPPATADQAPSPQAHPSVSAPDPLVAVPPAPSSGVAGYTSPLPFPPGPSGPVVDPVPAQPVPATPAVLLTGIGELKPPYPASKLASGEEALLRLRLTVDPGGRVVAVEPIGRADRVFLELARRHIMAHWRYRPATRDGSDVMATLVVSLRFKLDD